MATIDNYISLSDGFSPVIEKISRASNTVANKLEQVGGAANRAGNGFETAGTNHSDGVWRYPEYHQFPGT